MTRNLLHKTIIYGPFRSRRLGLSLGINVLNWVLKICTFNCQYCECGWTDIQPGKEIPFYEFPTVDDICRELEKSLKNSFMLPDHITFAGNGEPTLHPEFNEIVNRVTELRNKFSISSNTAILSNSTTVTKPEIRKTLSKIDVKIMKLDTGSQEDMEEYNGAVNEIKYDDIISGLKEMDNIIIQSLFTKGTKGNLTSQNINEWLYRVKEISPLYVQLYSLDRGYPSDEIDFVSDYDLETIRNLLSKEGIKSIIYR